jgi:hypothetical protein
VEFGFCKDPIHPVNEKSAVFWISAICGGNEADPYESMGSHLLRINLRNELFKLF